MKHTPFGKVKAKTLLYLRQTTGKERDLEEIYKYMLLQKDKSN